MECLYHRIRTKKGVKYGYCSLVHKECALFRCSCDSYAVREYKPIVSISSSLKTRKSPIIAHLERNRFSILTDDLDHCFICGSHKDHLHEIYEGSYRTRSMKYGCVIPLCHGCHHMIHMNHDIAVKYKMLCETRFCELYPDLEFNSLFYYKH